MTNDYNTNNTNNNGRESISDLQQHQSPLIVGDQIVLPIQEASTAPTPKKVIAKLSTDGEASQERSKPTPTRVEQNKELDTRGVSVAKTTKVESKYTDLAIRDEESDRIIGYYHPPSLSPEYDKPEIIPLNWNTGFPMINGVPYWERLPDEPSAYYQAFCHFRDQPQQANPELDPTSLIRSLGKTANHFNLDPGALEHVSEAWMWNQRVESYEQYADLLLQKHRASKIVVMEAEHSKMADDLLDKAKERLEGLDAEKLSPYVLLEFVRLSAEMKRLALRLDKELPSDPNDKPGQRDDNNNGINVSGENQKVQIILDRNWQST